MKPFTTLTVVFLALIAVMQFLRFMFGWPVAIEGTAVPVWVSGTAAAIAAVLAVTLWIESFGWQLPRAFHWLGRKTHH